MFLYAIINLICLYSTVKRSRNISVTGPRRCLTAQWQRVPSIGQNLKPFTGNGDVYIRVKNSRMGC